MNICTNCQHHFVYGYHYCNCIDEIEIDPVTGEKEYQFCINKNHDGNCEDFKQIPPRPKRWWKSQTYSDQAITLAWIVAIGSVGLILLCCWILFWFIYWDQQGVLLKWFGN
jgi:hypothetical protein